MDFHQRQTLINSIGGNTHAWIKDKEEEMYFCEYCSSIVDGNKWDPMIKCCTNCLEE